MDRQSAVLEFVAAAGWHGATAKRLAKATFGEPEFPTRENARLSAIYRDLHKLEREGKVVWVLSSRPMKWVAAECGREPGSVGSFSSAAERAP